MAAKKSRKTGAKASAKSVRAVATVSFHVKDLPPESVGKLPRGTVTLGPKNALAINVERLSRSLIRDQRARMVSSMGCASNPGGPGC
jgi:hypothetical protein